MCDPSCGHGGSVPSTLSDHLLHHSHQFLGDLDAQALGFQEMLLGELQVLGTGHDIAHAHVPVQLRVRWVQRFEIGQGGDAVLCQCVRDAEGGLGTEALTCVINLQHWEIGRSEAVVVPIQ